MYFNDIEKSEIFKDIKLIFNYLKEMIVPNIKNEIYYRCAYPDSDFIVVITIIPSKKNNMCFNVTCNKDKGKIKYIIPEYIDSFITKEEAENNDFRYDLTESYEEAFIIIYNWSRIKEACLEAINNSEKINEIIKNFKL